jgi:hypothetical protein
MSYLLPQNFGGVADAANDAHSSCIRDGGCEFGASCDVHSSGEVNPTVLRGRGEVTNPARKIGCLIPKSSVTGVVIVDIFWLYQLFLGGVIRKRGGGGNSSS